MDRRLKARSSATAEIARDADDVDYKFSEPSNQKRHRIQAYHSNPPSITPNDIPTHA